MVLSDSVKSLFSADKDLALSIKNIFGFYPGNIHLYKLAFRHKSAGTDELNGVKLNNERLEYLGDAILSAFVAEYLFKKYPYKNEGFLTEMRSKIVSRTSLNKLAKKLGFHNLVEANQENNKQFKSMHGDAFEAFIGALYLDKGFDFTRKVLIKRIIKIHIDLEKIEKEETNYKSRLIEWSQKEKHDLDFKVINEVGEGYNKQYVVEVHINGQQKEVAQDYSIKGAEQLAAEKTWQSLESDGMIKESSDK